ncbi:MAG: SLC13 family permease [Myxococcota bacterium]
MDPQLIVVLAIIGVTVVFIVTELVRIDIVAIMAMLALTWTGSITPEEARSGFSSNAIVAIMGVMVMGHGLYRSGVTEKIASFILKVAGRSKRRIISTVSVTVGVMSGFMQNIGAAALFLPVMMGISEREKIPISALLMPMGFAALLGGTLTMIGTSSLIILNDLLSTRGLETFSLFTVTPIGIALLSVGIVYFFLIGDHFQKAEPEPRDEMPEGKKLVNVWGLSDSIFTYEIPEDSLIIGQSVEQTEMGARYNVNLLAIDAEVDDVDYEIDKEHVFESGQELVVQGRLRDVERFAIAYDLELTKERKKTPEPKGKGYLEVVIPARSNLVGKTIREMQLRERHNVQVVIFFSDSEVIEEDLADRTVKAGDTLILHGRWEHLQYFQESQGYITVTPLEYEQKKPEKALLAVGSFVAAIAMVFLMKMPISLGFLTGAIVMVLGRVMTIEEAYEAIEWKVIFLIAGLIPIGIAMEKSGAAALIAEGLVGAVESIPAFFILLIIGLLTTGFSLLMSNVAATVLLVPLVLNIAGVGGLSAQVLVLQVGVCAANSFIIPTHHVNALLMTPGGYAVKDYVTVGGILSLIFILVSTTMLYFFYM